MPPAFALGQRRQLLPRSSNSFSLESVEARLRVHRLYASARRACRFLMVLGRGRRQTNAENSGARTLQRVRLLLSQTPPKSFQHREAASATTAPPDMPWGNLPALYHTSQ